MGPLVVAGVVVEDERALRRLGVKDSKKLSPARRAELHPEILRISKVHVETIDAAEIDTRREKENLNDIEVGAFAKILKALRPAVAYLDAADVVAKRFGERVREASGLATRVVSRHKADATFAVVSAASIVAKVERDREVIKIAASLGVSPEELGSGYPSDPLTVAFLRKRIKETGSLPAEARASWKTSSRLLGEARGRRIDEW